MASFKPNLNCEKVFALGFIVLSLTLGSSPSLAQLPELPPAPAAPPAFPSPPSSPTPSEQSPSDSPYLRPQAACPDDLATLSALLIRDIPGYTNRIIQSSVADIPTAYRPSYVITASFPERMPLEIRDRVYTTDADSGDLLEQVFFTTLERQYSGLEATSLSHFHWLFLFFCLSISYGNHHLGTKHD